MIHFPMNDHELQMRRAIALAASTPDSRLNALFVYEANVEFLPE